VNKTEQAMNTVNKMQQVMKKVLNTVTKKVLKKRKKYLK
jgi:hypothetical protein